MRAFPLVLSAPSGAGKTSIARELLRVRSDTGYSISCTTRRPRPGEQHGVDYYFLSEAEFEEERVAGGFAEWAEVHGNLYGTLSREVKRILDSGRHPVMDIDIQGAVQLLSAFPDSVSVFILPPSSEALITRLDGRRSEDSSALRLRLDNALLELLAATRYDYVVVNDQLDTAVRSVSAIIEAEMHRVRRMDDLEHRIRQLSAGLADAGS